jgi:enamine deaminase RidA (YjgF/YER057c/UK114 family)
MHDVVRMNSYLTRPQDLAANLEIRRRYYTQEPPAATLVFVSGLADPDFMIEVEVIAVVD